MNTTKEFSLVVLFLIRRIYLLSDGIEKEYEQIYAYPFFSWILFYRRHFDEETSCEIFIMWNGNGVYRFLKSYSKTKEKAGYCALNVRNNQLSRFLYSIEAFIKRNHATKLRFVESILNGMFFRNHATKMQGFLPCIFAWNSRIIDSYHEFRPQLKSQHKSIFGGLHIDGIIYGFVIF